ncbi:neuralized-like protein 4 [Ischnura elegans]|uniref:neuralized-like protein 4 n=1 Tax=Ischnura elegans TaxID=197161 RepID=UPI001ED8B6C4|nr:neuralized-like protein 4 [Ischnura elegans]
MVNRFILLALIGLQLLLVLSSGAVSEGDCPKAVRSQNVLKVTYDRKLNESDGQWMTIFSARRIDTINTTADLKMEATQSAVECGGKHEIQVEIIVKDVQGSNPILKASQEDKLRFYHRHASNVVIFNGGRSLQRINLQKLDNAAAFTHRPLKDNEMFEVRLDKKYSDVSHSPGIGVMAHSPDDVAIPGSMLESTSTWMYHRRDIHSAGKVVSKNYGVNSFEIEVGDTVGVMKRDNGSVHFFVKGIDQGPALTNAPSILYGIYEVRGMSAKATIVN